jgi:Ni/Co efflux regulator RcnB
MRKLLIGFLLASVAASPALGAAYGQPTSNRAERTERARTQQQQQKQSARPERSRSRTETRARPSTRTTSRPNNRANVGRPATPVARVQQPRPNARVTPTVEERRARAVERRTTRTQAPTRAPAPTVTPPRRPAVSNVPRPGTEPPLRTQARPTPRPHWNSSWRNDRRYDWRDWRRRHHSRFHLHLYVDPFGWGYHRYWIGWRMWPQFYASRYWIADPWMYRLPPAPPGTRWVRYYNDALLVDLWTGEVIDVLHDFFW